MSKWRVSLSHWKTEIDADDEGDALMQADSRFSFMSEARAEEICQEDEAESEEAQQ